MTAPSESPPQSRLKIWWAGARPRTLGASIAPVLVGGAIAHTAIGPFLPSFALCLLVSIALQVGVNYANDYFDGVRGVDERRVGPLRLTASGLVPAKRVLAAALLCFTIAGLAGLYLSLRTDSRLLVVGAAAIVSALAYSGGPQPYAGLGMGELFVFVFFGVVPVAGTSYAMTMWAYYYCAARLTCGVPAAHIPASAWWLGAAMGFFAVAILLANNIRDIATDAASGKRTLPVRLGDGTSRVLYRVCLLMPFVLLVARTAFRFQFEELPAIGALLIAIGPYRRIANAKGPALIPVLVRTGYSELAFAVLFSIPVLVIR